VAYRGAEVSHRRPGRLAQGDQPLVGLGDVALASGGRLIAVSLYGIWDLINGPPRRNYVEATLHRAISDLSVVFQEPGADLILVAGDFNLYTYPVGDALTDRSLTVWDRLAAYGLQTCGPFRPRDEPRLAPEEPALPARLLPRHTIATGAAEGLLGRPRPALDSPQRPPRHFRHLRPVSGDRPLIGY
jgi:hypothetical protein